MPQSRKVAKQKTASTASKTTSQQHDDVIRGRQRGLDGLGNGLNGLKNDPNSSQNGRNSLKNNYTTTRRRSTWSSKGASTELKSLKFSFLNFLPVKVFAASSQLFN